MFKPGNFKGAFIIMALTLLALTLVVHAQEGIKITPSTMPSPVSSPGSIPMEILVNGQQRTQLYLGDVAQVIFCLTNFQGSTFVSISIEAPYGTQNLGSGYVEGGYCYYFDLEIVPPIYQGSTYTITVYAQDSYGDTGTGSVSYVEMYAPPVSIDQISVLTENGTPTTTLVLGNTYQVSVTLSNTGQEDYTYQVVITTASGAFKASGSVTVDAGSSNTVTFEVTPSSFPQGFSDKLEVYVYDQYGDLLTSGSMSINIIPPRPGPFSLVSVSGNATLKEGLSNTITVTLLNNGWSGNIVNVTVIPSFNAAVTASPSSYSFGQGSEVTININITPYVGGTQSIELILQYSSPYTNNVYTDKFIIPVSIYVKLALNAVLTNGSQLSSVCLELNGSCASTTWVLPGTYEVEAPQIVPLSSNTRLVFSNWSVGGNSNPLTINVKNSMNITAYYNTQYLVVIEDPVSGHSVNQWFTAGSTFMLSIPSTVPISNNSRWVFNGWSGDCQNMPNNLVLTINRPITCEVMWTKQYLVTIYTVLDGNVKSESSEWVNNGESISINVYDYEPNTGLSFLVTPLYSGYSVNGMSGKGKQITFTVTQPTDVYIYWYSNYTGAAGLGAALALISLGVFYRNKLGDYTRIMRKRLGTTILRRGEELNVEPLEQDATKVTGTRVYRAEEENKQEGGTKDIKAEPYEEKIDETKDLSRENKEERPYY